MLLGGKRCPPSPYQDALEDVEQVVHAREVADILEGSHENGGQDGKGAGEEHPGEAGPAELQEALGTRRNLRPCPSPCLGHRARVPPPPQILARRGMGGITPFSMLRH